MTNPPSPDLTAYRPQGDQPHPPGHPPGSGRKRPPPKRRRRGFGIIGWLGFLVLALFAVVVGALAVFIAAPPTDFIRDQMITQVKEKTGRDLTIAGPVGITIFPSLGVSLKDVSLSSKPGMGGAPLTTMSDLNVQVKLLPLLKKQVEVDTLVLTNPVFNLRVDNQGQRSWDFAHLTTPRRIQLADASANSTSFIKLAQANTGATATSGGNAIPLEQVALGDVRIINGTLNYADATSGASQSVKKINVALALENLASPLGAKGDLNWKAEQIAFDGTLTSPKQIMDKQPASVDVKITNRRFAANYKGKMHLADALELAGKVNANVPSVRDLAGWLGTKLPPSNGFGPMKLSGNLTAKGPTYALSKATLDLDGAKATGTVSVGTGGQRPKITANLNLSQLNLNTYLSGGTAAPGGTPAPAAGKKPASIDDLLADPDEAPGPRVKGYSQRTGWSNAPIDMSALGLVDADAKLNVGKLLYQKIKVDSTKLAVKLAAGKMRADFTEVKLYGGQGRGVVTLDGNKTPTVGANIVANNIAALPLLTDAIDFKSVEGKGNFTLAIAGRGRSQRSLIETLNGNGSFKFNDGALVGFNIPAAYRALRGGQIPDLKAKSTEKTDFSALTATFKIQNGIATNDDLSMLSPLLRVTGAGRVLLPQRQVDYLARPTIVSNLTGQGGDEAKGLEIPVRIVGPFEKLEFKPQLGNVLKDKLLKDPGKTVETIKKLTDKYKGKKANEIINDLIGKDDGSGEKKIDAKKLLDNLFQ